MFSKSYRNLLLVAPASEDHREIVSYYMKVVQCTCLETQQKEGEIASFVFLLVKNQQGFEKFVDLLLAMPEVSLQSLIDELPRLSQFQRFDFFLGKLRDENYLAPSMIRQHATLMRIFANKAEELVEIENAKHQKSGRLIW